MIAKISLNHLKKSISSISGNSGIWFVSLIGRKNDKAIYVRSCSQVKSVEVKIPASCKEDFSISVPYNSFDMIKGSYIEIVDIDDNYIGFSSPTGHGRVFGRLRNISLQTGTMGNIPTVKMVSDIPSEILSKAFGLCKLMITKTYEYSNVASLSTNENNELSIESNNLKSAIRVRFPCNVVKPYGSIFVYIDDFYGLSQLSGNIDITYDDEFVGLISEVFKYSCKLVSYTDNWIYIDNLVNSNKDRFIGSLVVDDVEGLNDALTSMVKFRQSSRKTSYSKSSPLLASDFITTKEKDRMKISTHTDTDQLTYVCKNVLSDRDINFRCIVDDMAKIVSKISKGVKSVKLDVYDRFIYMIGKSEDGTEVTFVTSTLSKNYV